MVEKQEAAATQIDGFKQLEMMRKIEEEDRQLKHKLHDVQSLHDVVISGYQDSHRQISDRQNPMMSSSIGNGKFDVASNPVLLPASRIQQNIQNLHYQMEKVKGCLKEARELKEIRQR